MMNLQVRYICTSFNLSSPKTVASPASQKKFFHMKKISEIKIIYIFLSEAILK